MRWVKERFTQYQLLWILLSLCILSVLSSCNEKTSVTYNTFPVEQARVDDFTSSKECYWNSGNITFQNGNRQVILLEHDPDAMCVVTLQSLDNVSVSALSAMYVYGNNEIITDGIHLQAQKHSDDIAAQFLPPEISDIIRSEWKEFLAYWENPVRCEGNRIQWSGGNEDYTIQIKLSRADADTPWMLENIVVYTEEFKQIHRQEIREIIRGYPNFSEYGSIAEMETDLRLQDEECYGAVNGEISALEFHTELPYPDFLYAYPNFLSSQNGYACGVLSDTTECLKVWCSPGIGSIENEQIYYFHYLPGEIPVIYIIS